MRYRIVIEKTGTGFSAYSPELSGCAATGATRAEVKRNIREAIEFHVDGVQRELASRKLKSFNVVSNVGKTRG